MRNGQQKKGYVMKIVIVQEAGRHEKNAEFRECLSFQRALLGIGCDDVDVWGKGYTGFENGFPGADVTIVLEQYDDGWLPAEDIRKLSDRVVYWSIDTHIALDAHRRIRDRLQPKLTYSAVYGKIKELDATWLPNCVDTRLFVSNNAFDDRPIYVGFCGSVGASREYMINRLIDDVGMVSRHGLIGHEMVMMLNNYKISFNMNIGEDINYRTFESMACGCVLLTNNSPGLSLLFDSNDLMVYDDLSDCKKIIRSNSDNVDKLREIAASGRRKVIDFHTYRNRALQIMNEVTGGLA